MQRSTPVRKPNTSTSDLLTWSEAPPTDSSATVTGLRSRQPSDKISKVLHGGQVTEDEARSLEKTKPCSGYKMKEMTGSGIFSASAEDSTSEAKSASNSKTGIRMYQQAMTGISQISFSTEESISPKKPTSLPEVAKQRELSGTLKSESDAKSKKISNAKSKELSGHDIFGAPAETTPRSLAAARTLESKESKDMGEPAPRNVRTSVKVSNPAGGQSKILIGEEPPKASKKIHGQKFAELTGNNIFNVEASPGSAEKPLSRAKLREMTGSNIFADGQAEARDCLRGARRPPGGESSITLV
ncbi:uncharacterized protein LOC114749843 [Neltuma alba]|uniref:uncharacterized protein LOC114714571 n=1 Tax=Neltuma alba TaxID=207710 RepID=UPI0010A3C329|nr:uncharacterized protein LOC114714571 [Prosopis alba]XP_028794220.1 uncharacterized protein LOC114749843 [Prosopis alba]